MATKIVFTDKVELEVDEEPAELAQALSHNDAARRAQFAGNYLYLRTAQEEDVWVNPAEVAYLTKG